MKKIYLLTLVLSLLLSVSGCSNIKLETGQSSIVFKKDSSVTVSSVLSDKEAKNDFNIRFKDSSKDIKEDLIDELSDRADIKMKKFKKGKDYISFTYTSEDADDLDYYVNLTLEDFADDSGYKDLENMLGRIKFNTYDKDKKVYRDDIDKYEDDYVQRLTGGSKGTYYKMPKKILLVADALKYDKISNDTIFVKKGSSGLVVFKK